MKRKSILLLAGIVIVGGLVFFGLRGWFQPTIGGGPNLPPSPVSFMTITPKATPISFSYVGQVAASKDIEIRARVTGIIESKLYQEGSFVKAGDPLFSIEPSPYKAELSAAEAVRAVARANLTKANLDYDRLVPLLDLDAISQKEMDDATAAKDMARAELKAAEARVTTATINLGYTTIRAPIDGVTSQSLLKEGALVDGNQYTLLTTMATTDPAYIHFSMSEKEHRDLRHALLSQKLLLSQEGFSVAVTTEDGAVLPLKGRLDFKDYKTDSATGAIAARAVIENPNQTLSPGQFVHITLTGALRPNAITVPQRAVMDGPTGKFVYVVGKDDKQKNIALPRPVEVGIWTTSDHSEEWIIEKGLSKGDHVIVEGTARIFFPGAPIIPSPASSTAPAKDSLGKPVKPSKSPI